jgi:hypothetical protein
MADAALQSRVRYTGTFRFSFGCPGWCAVPSPRQAGRSRDTRSRQEDPIRVRILIDIQNLSYTAVSGVLGCLQDQEADFARRAIPRPRPSQILCAKYPPVERLYATSARRSNRPPSRLEKPMDNAARTRQRVLAIFLPVTAVLYIGGEALSLKGTDQVSRLPGQVRQRRRLRGPSDLLRHPRGDDPCGDSHQLQRPPVAGSRSNRPACRHQRPVADR